jgi:hypothetical protein
LTVFPNPVKDKLTIHNHQFKNETVLTYSIVNVLGEQILSDTPVSFEKDQEAEVDCRMLSPGIISSN